MAPTDTLRPTASSVPRTPTVAPDCRLGLTLGVRRLPPEAMLRAFRAGVYYDYGTFWNAIGIPDVQPTREVYGAQHIILVRVHNAMATPGAYYWGSEYLLPTPGTPSWELLGGGVAATAQAQAMDYTAGLYPGALWLIGNEIDHPDMSWPPGMLTQTPVPPFPTPTYRPPPRGNQDGILPGSYAQAYHDLYYRIKGLDPTAAIAPGSVTQWTPMREEYYNQVLAAYASMYGASMPVDWWNVHNYILSEQYWSPGCGYTPTPLPGSQFALATPYCFGPNAGYPPGWPTPGTPQPGDAVTPVPTARPWPEGMVDATAFKDQLINFRRWLKANGYQDTPVIVSEFGVSRSVSEEQAKTFLFQQVMPWMLNYSDPDIGYPRDGYRLVQTAVYFSANILPNANYSLYRYEDGEYFLTGIGNAWTVHVNDPANGYTAKPCDFGRTTAP